MRVEASGCSLQSRACCLLMYAASVTWPEVCQVWLSHAVQERDPTDFGARDRHCMHE